MTHPTTSRRLRRPDLLATNIDRDTLRALAGANDARVAWLIADLPGFLPPGPIQDDALVTFEQLPDVDLKAAPVPWATATNPLIGWDVPTPPEYVRRKGQVFAAIDDRWARIRKSGGLSNRRCA